MTGAATQRNGKSIKRKVSEAGERKARKTVCIHSEISREGVTLQTAGGKAGEWCLTLIAALRVSGSIGVLQPRQNL